MLNVSTLCGTSSSPSDALRYGRATGRRAPYRSASERRPVVVWNSTRACNLACRHCYASAKAVPDPQELDTKEAVALLENLASYRVPTLLLSGGEPLARPDFMQILEGARRVGLPVTISTNGTLIDRSLAEFLARVSIGYVGVSLDGPADIHDKLRCMKGAWEASVAGLQALGRAGIKRGVRFTLTPQTYEGLPAVLETVRALGIERFCMYHLVPSGRGGRLLDVTWEQRLEALHMVFEFAASCLGVEVLTVANPSDAVALYLWLKQRFPDRAEAAYAAMSWNGGARNGSGVGLACIDEKGTVYPDQFSRHRPIGSVRQEPFDRLWERWRADRNSGPSQISLPQRCRSCGYLSICGGGLRVRAEAVTGDPAGFDPSCVLGPVEEIPDTDRSEQHDRLAARCTGAN